MTGNVLRFFEETLAGKKGPLIGCKPRGQSQLSWRRQTAESSEIAPVGLW
jgi:hypothetical protein